MACLARPRDPSGRKLIRQSAVHPRTPRRRPGFRPLVVRSRSGGEGIRVARTTAPLQHVADAHSGDHRRPPVLHGIDHLQPQLVQAHREVVPGLRIARNAQPPVVPGRSVAVPDITVAPSAIDGGPALRAVRLSSARSRSAFWASSPPGSAMSTRSGKKTMCRMTSSFSEWSRPLRPPGVASMDGSGSNDRRPTHPVREKVVGNGRRPCSDRVARHGRDSQSPGPRYTHRIPCPTVIAARVPRSCVRALHRANSGRRPRRGGSSAQDREGVLRSLLASATWNRGPGATGRGGRR